MNRFFIKAIYKTTNPIRRMLYSRRRSGSVGPRILANCIPKAGTHLLMRCLSFLPGLANFHYGVFIHGMNRIGWEGRHETLSRMGSGCFCMVHLPYQPMVARAVDDMGLRTLLLVRDPRDLVVSQMFFTKRIATDVNHRALVGMRDDEARLSAMITGSDLKMSDVGARLEHYLGWVDHGSCVLRFENLIGPSGDGGEDLQKEEILKIARYCGIELSDRRLSQVASRLFDRHSYTFRKGRIGDWRNHFSEEHRAAFKELAGEVLIRLGYEEDHRW